MRGLERSGWRLMALAFCVLTALLALQRPAAAQDSQYWTMQYGNQARLLGGVVVGGAQDVSATYYNPGRLALLESPEVLLAGNVFDYTSLSIAGAVEDSDFKSTRLGSVPSLFAGQIRGLSRGKSQWAYSFLGRYSSQFRFDERRDIAAILEYPVDQASGAFSLDESLSEYWAGLTWAYPLSEHIGIGATGYVAVRSQRSRVLITAQAARADTAGIALQRRDFDLNHWSVLAKIGIGADLGAWQLGLVATTPNLKILGSGSLGFDESFTAQDLDGNGSMPSRILTGYEEGVDARHEAAPSLALGVSYEWRQSTVHASAEWFAGVAGYEVLAGEPIVSSDGSVTRRPVVSDARDAVLNAGVGLSHRFRDDLAGYLSFRTDYSSTPRQDSSQLAVSIWDIYHVGAGATFVALRTTFTLGVIYAFGNEEAPSAAKLIPDTGEESPIAEDDGMLEYRFRRFTGLLGFTFGF